jgi:hypothetical protein
MITNYVNFEDAIDYSIRQLKNYGAEVDTGRWQGVPTEGKPDLITLELMDVAFRVSMDQAYGPAHVYTEDPMGPLPALRDQIKPNLPWADDHFAERVSRDPSNPGEQYKNWPWWKGQDAQAMAKEGPFEEPIFTHTYQERFWAHYANSDPDPNWGIRYEYGDLDDVVDLLLKDPYSRQAYLPIFFPEDTGAVHGGRIPCTLGYHALLRNDQLHLWYSIRSCDAVRHFRDDLYLAARLALWIIDECYRRAGEREDQGQYDPWLEPPRPGILTFHAFSFHVHKGDLHLL